MEKLFLSAKTIKNRLKLISGGEILDVCTGKGDFITTLMNTLTYNSFIGIDLSKEELESTKKKFEQHPVTLLEMNAETLEFENDSFDTVCISHSLHHLSTIDNVLTEMKRVLKPGGYFIIQESYGDGNQTEAQKTRILQHDWTEKMESLLEGIPHTKTLPKQRIIDIVESLGLNEVETFDAPHNVYCLFCEKQTECFPDPKSEQIIKRAINKIDTNLNRLKEYPDLNKYKDTLDVKQFNEEAEQIKERLQQYGSAPASILFFIGKK